jgi:para-aminobenzoate synthetase/4-amino-4-deoxychorismate lyase
VPDPRHGVFETLLVLDGHPIELDAHLARLEASLDELFPRQAHPVLEVPSMPTGVLRIAVAPGADGQLAATTECRPTNGHFAPDNGGQSSTRAVSLRSLRLAGGLGAHKWVDRALLDDAQATLPEGTLPLLIDEEGSVLEASRANVFAVRGDVLLTPPLDGRILPGVTRMRTIELAGELGIEAREARLSLADLLGADEVFLTGSVRGIEPVGAIDGTVLSSGGNVASELGAELRRTWIRAKVG